MKKIGIVFSGGGAKGAYELGVWRAFHEKEVDKNINGVSGTSIGGLTAAFFATGDIETFESIWNFAKLRKAETPKILKTKVAQKLDNHLKENIKLEDIYTAFDNCQNENFLSSERVNEELRKTLSLNKIRTSPMECFVTCHNLKKKEVVYFNLRNIKNDEKAYSIIRATASIPIIFEPVKVDDYILCDGGISDNTPILPLYDLGFDVIIVVSLKTPKENYQAKYPNSKILNIYPDQYLGNFINGSLNFYEGEIERKAQEGYNDAIHFLDNNKELL